MKEWITGRNPVYEVLKANRRQFFRLLLATGLEEKARLQEITRLAGERRLKIERVPRQQLDALANGPESHQGVALQASGYMYSDVPAIIAAAEKSGEPLFVLALDALQNPQNVGTLLRTAGAVGVHGVIIPLAHTATITPAAILCAGPRRAAKSPERRHAAPHGWRGGSAWRHHSPGTHRHHYPRGNPRLCRGG